MFLSHYAWRSFAYPLLQRGGKPSPALIWLLAVAFCMYNGLLQVLTMLCTLQSCCMLIMIGFREAHLRTSLLNQLRGLP